jgi:hypothetical protein
VFTPRPILQRTSFPPGKSFYFHILGFRRLRFGLANLIPATYCATLMASQFLEFRLHLPGPIGDIPDRKCRRLSFLAWALLCPIYGPDAGEANGLLVSSFARAEISCPTRNHLANHVDGQRCGRRRSRTMPSDLQNSRMRGPNAGCSPCGRLLHTRFALRSEREN